MHIVKERVLTRARGERVPQEAAASEGFSASTVWVVGLVVRVVVHNQRYVSGAAPCTHVRVLLLDQLQEIRHMSRLSRRGMFS